MYVLKTRRNLESMNITELHLHLLQIRLDNLFTYSVRWHDTRIMMNRQIHTE